jgi:peroxiredoxin
MKKFIVLLLASALVTVVAGGAFAAEEKAAEAKAPAATAEAKAPAATAEVEKAPAGLTFSLKDGEGNVFNQDNLKGKKTMLVIAQMACRQCRAEMDDMNVFADQLTDNAYVLLVDMNTEVAQRIWKDAGYKMNLVIDPDFTLPELLGVRSTPATVVLDKDLKVIFSKSGYRPGQFEDIMEELN